MPKKPAASKQFTEEEKKELRKKQQQRALEFQRKIDEELKNETERIHSQYRSTKMETVDDEEEEEEEEEETEAEEETQQSDFFENFEKEISNLEINDPFLSKPTEKSNAVVKADNKEADLTYGQFYFEDMLKEYEKNIDRENNQQIGKTLQDNLELIKTSKSEFEFWLLNKKF